MWWMCALQDSKQGTPVPGGTPLAIALARARHEAALQGLSAHVRHPATCPEMPTVQELKSSISGILELSMWLLMRVQTGLPHKQSMWVTFNGCASGARA